MWQIKHLMRVEAAFKIGVEEKKWESGEERENVQISDHMWAFHVQFCAEFPVTKPFFVFKQEAAVWLCIHESYCPTITGFEILLWNLQRCSIFQCHSVHCLSSSWFFFYVGCNLPCKEMLEMCCSHCGGSDKCCSLGFVTIVHDTSDWHFRSTCCLHLHVNACWHLTDCRVIVTELAFKQPMFMCAEMGKKHP